MQAVSTMSPATHMKEEAIFFLDMREKDPNFQKTHCFSIIIVDLNGEYTIYTLHL